MEKGSVKIHAKFGKLSNTTVFQVFMKKHDIFITTRAELQVCYFKFSILVNENKSLCEI